VLAAVAAGAEPSGRAAAKPAAKPVQGEQGLNVPVEIRGKRVEYSGREGRVTFTGNVVVTRGTARLLADEVTTLRGTSEASARGNVMLKDAERKIDLTCAEAAYTHGLRQVMASGTCHLIAGEGDSLTVVDSDEMEVFVENKEAIARGNVRIMQGENEAECRLAHLYGKEHRAVLFGDPVLRHPPHEFRSDEVVSFFQEGKLVLNGNVRARIHAGKLDTLGKEGSP